MIELLPCPFCGGEAELTDMSHAGWDEPYQIHCEEDCYLGLTHWYTKESKDRLIKEWNIRVKQ